MAISEIEKLERRYAENPQGLTFAPLAEVHRKNGDVAKALGLLGPGLALHPDYIPASIVLGRCHLDLGDMQSAESAFTHVLGLDSENVIALKALADITERLLRLDESERWLHTLLAVDRSNEEARAQLNRVVDSRRMAETVIAANAAAGTSTEPAADAGETPPPPPPLEELPAEPGMGWVTAPDEPTSEEAVPLAFQDLEPETLEPSSEPVEPLSGIVGLTEAPDVSHVEPLGGWLTEDIRVEMSEDIILQSSGASEFQMPNASEEFFDTASVPEETESLAGRGMGLDAGTDKEHERASLVEPESASLVEPEPVSLAEPAGESAAETVRESQPPALVDLEPEGAGITQSAEAAEPPVGAAPEPEPLPDPMVTESMAELLVSQGHREEALRVYRELDGRSGDLSRWQERIAELEQPRSAPTPRREYTAGATGGRSTRDFLAAMLSARPPHVPPPLRSPLEAPPSATATEATGAPTRPAHDALSLSSVFGEEGTPSRPAVPAGGGGHAGVSYDEFFKAPAPGGGMPRPPRSPDQKSDDLDQFHTWLQNLKR